MISRWKKKFLERAPELFKKGPSEAEKAVVVNQGYIADLEWKVGYLSCESHCMKKIYLIMKCIDETNTAHPIWGNTTIYKVILREDKIIVNSKKD